MKKGDVQVFINAIIGQDSKNLTKIFKKQKKT